MGRPRSFDEQSVLDAAAKQFRIHGFANTSTEQLCDAAGVRRSSLYNTFTSKEELFIRALTRYIEVTDRMQDGVLADDSLSGRQRLEGSLELIIAEEVEAARLGHAAGCMVVGAYMTPNFRERDQRIKQLLDDSLQRRLLQLSQVIRSGQRDGSLRSTLDPKEAALLVVTLISGLRVNAQAGATPNKLRQVATLGLSALMSN